MNADSVAASYDDNEVTLWKTDGRPSTAWVEYQFDQPATLSEIDLKLAAFSTRSYPLRITVDGKTVWEASTERQPGYTFATFPAITGRAVRITQVGPTRGGGGGAPRLAEVDATRQAGDTGADQVREGWELGVIEVDFHGPVGSN